MSLSRDDLSVIEGDARVSSRRLAEALGFARHDHFVRLLKERIEELEDFDRIFLIKEEKSGRGRPSQTYYLNEHQATALCMWAETATARTARRQIIEVFVAWRRGDLGARDAERDGPDAAFLRDGDRAEAALRHLRGVSGIDELLREITHLPIWPSKRRPSWWHHLDVREFLTVAHRQMSTIEAARQGKAHFGDRCPGKSSIHSYWQRLDVAKTGRTLHLRPASHYRNPILPAPIKKENSA